MIDGGGGRLLVWCGRVKGRSVDEIGGAGLNFLVLNFSTR
jgi:hypothetical protein